MCHSLNWDDSVIAKTDRFWEQKIYWTSHRKGLRNIYMATNVTNIPLEPPYSQHCDFCTESNKQEQDIVHLLYYCPFTQKILKVLLQNDP